MRRIERVYGILSLALMIIVLLTGCSPGTSEPAPERPKHDIQIEVYLETNLFLNTYDVEIRIDGEKIGVVKQGETFTGTVSLEEGDHDFKVNKSGDSSVNGSTTIKITEDMCFSCSLKSRSGGIDINDQIEETLTAHAERIEKEEAERAEKEAAEKAEQERLDAELQAEMEAMAEEQARIDALQSTLAGFEGKRLSEVYDEISSLGIPVKYIATNSNQDMTSVIGDVADSYFVESAKLGFWGDSVTVKVTPESVLEDQRKKQELESILDPSVAWGTVDLYGQREYAGFRLHIMRMYAESPTDDGAAWFLKAPCTVTNMYGVETEMTCEAKVGGTTTDPVILSFIVY